MAVGDEPAQAPHPSGATMPDQLSPAALSLGGWRWYLFAVAQLWWRRWSPLAADYAEPAGVHARKPGRCFPRRLVINEFFEDAVKPWNQPFRIQFPVHVDQVGSVLVLRVPA